MCATNPDHKNDDAGFTLMELIVVIAISGILFVGIIMALHENLRLLDQQARTRDAAMLSQNLMHEIRAKQFADPETPTSFGAEETNRPNYDDVDDYDDLTNSPPRTIEGVSLSRYADLTRSVAVVNVNQNGINTNAPQPDGSSSFKRITVTVSGPRVSVSNVSVVAYYDD